MRKNSILPVLIFLWFGTASGTDQTIFLKWERELSPIRINGGWQTGAPELDTLLAEYGVIRIAPFLRQTHTSPTPDPAGLKRILRLELPAERDPSALLDRLRQLPGAVYAESPPERRTDFLFEKSLPRGLDEVPGDPLYPEQWCYPIMQAPSAWDVTHGDPSVVVAIVDNGTDWQHPDLAANIWVNPGEIANNSIDDDQNGFVDDVRGWDFYDSDNDPAPGTSNDIHGTHTAGLVGALMDNNRGVVGMAPSCKVMVVRSGSGSTITYGLQGIVYASHNGADIISLSWGGSGSNSTEQDVITDALLQGSMIVAAAGNNGNSSPHYPAAYDGVMAVAATGPTDEIWSSSNFGTWISVCAPGLSILSLVPNGYGVTSGTSMSTPLVAGVAALIKSYHPGWTADQIYGQIQYTADNIDAKNPLYVGLIGTGRVNAYRAVAETAPGLQINGLPFDELSGDFDGRLDPGETAALILSLHNSGGATSNVEVSLFSNDPAVQILQGTWNLAEFPSGADADNSSNPFQISIALWSQTNREAQLTFSIEAENFYAASLEASIWIDPAFADHDTGNVIFTLTDFGAFGYYGYTHPSDPLRGSGFRFPPGGSNALFHGSLMAGTSASKVSDCAYGNSTYTRYDWATTPDGEISITAGTLADQEGIAVYKDTSPPLNEQVGLEVTQHSYAWGTPPNDDFVILSYDLKNTSGAALTDLFVGQYMDWDLLYFDENEANWDSDYSLGYVYNQQPLAPNTRYYGTSLLTGNLASYRVIDNYSEIPQGMTDLLKYGFMSDGMVKTASTGPSDQATLLSAGPFSLDIGETLEVAFAILGGNNLADLRDNANAALSAWAGFTQNSTVASPVSLKFEIKSVFPRPSNGDLQLIFFLPGAGEVNFTLFDLLGRATPIWHGRFSEAGSYKISIPRWEGASGVYFLEGVSPYGNSTTRIVWIK